MIRFVKQTISRVLAKILLWDVDYLNRKMLLFPSVHGPGERLIVGRDTDLNNTVFNTMSGTISVGDYAFFGHHCQVLTGTHHIERRDNARRGHPTDGRNVRIGQGVWVGSGVIILGGVSIADHAVIAAGSVVTRDCPEPAVYGGIPARKLRDIVFEADREVR